MTQPLSAQEVAKFLQENPEIMVEVSERVRKASGLDGGLPDDVMSEADDVPISLDD